MSTANSICLPREPDDLPHQRTTPLPYGRQSLSADDIAAVVEVLQSPWLTTGPCVERFEAAIAAAAGADHAVAVSSGTAALHAAVASLGLGPGDQVIVPTMTFAASANCLLYQGARPVFADVDPQTLLLDPTSLERLVNRHTRAVIAVDYAGQPCDYDVLGQIARKHGLALVADAAHSLGASDRGRPVGSLADLTTFSFHPVKPITCGEGGAIVTNDAGLAQRMRQFRNHGINLDFRQRSQMAAHRYEMIELGFNYRLSDIHCALGLSQIQRLDSFIARRRAVARWYDQQLVDLPGVAPLAVREAAEHGYHIYVVRLDSSAGLDRDTVFQRMRSAKIGVNVHYPPVHLHPYYREHLGTGVGMCPQAESAYDEILTLPLFAEMTEDDVADTVAALRWAIAECRA